MTPLMAKRLATATLCLMSLFGLSACGGGGSSGSSSSGSSASSVSSSSSTAAAYIIRVSVSGLSTNLSSVLVLQNNGGNDLDLPIDGNFYNFGFLAVGATYNVTVKTQPTTIPRQTCSVASGTGTVAAADVTIAVTCTDVSSGSWVWRGGSQSANVIGLYGMIGQPAVSNAPGARSGAASWTDANGNFWLFGGSGFASASPGYLNDLWKFNPSTREWTWVSGSNTANAVGIYGTQGVSSGANVPGARLGASSWIDQSGNLWLFGGYGYGDNSSGIRSLNDLWKYNPGTKQWAWVSGSSSSVVFGTYGTKGVPTTGNVPGARLGASSWIDQSGNLWLFGGFGYGYVAFGFLDDLWKFNPGTGQWTWVDGDYNAFFNDAWSFPDYGYPSKRSDAVSWTDNTGDFWIFGGYTGYGGTTNGNANQASLNDLWRYNVLSGMWTCMRGCYSYPNGSGVYLVKEDANVVYEPGARKGGTGWTDKSDNLWLFGGNFYRTNSVSNAYNDLWKYNLTTGLWTWVNGSSATGSPSIYGTLDISSAFNVPGGRYGSSNWIDVQGNLWLFGGSSTNDLKNDLWQFELH